MRVILQRVKKAHVVVESEIVGRIEQGYLLLIGFEKGDSEDLLSPMIEKILKLKVFADENGRFSHSLEEQNGSILAVSQFTLFADMKKGKKISWSKACEPTLAEELYDRLIAKLKEWNVEVQTGIFGASMEVESVNDGPVTLILDSKELFPSLYKTKE